MASEVIQPHNILFVELILLSGNGIDTGVSGAGGGCITTGPFASYNLSLGPSTTPTNQCITRTFSNMFVSSLSSAQIANTTKQQTFENFRIEVEGFSVPPTLKAHDGGHFAVGDETRDRYSSPGGESFCALVFVFN
jgi:tyrosinase